jgi:hypothetical protein
MSQPHPKSRPGAVEVHRSIYNRVTATRWGPDAAGTPRRTRRAAPAKTLKTLDEQRDKLLGLYYAEKISADGFHREEARIATSIYAVRQQTALEGQEDRTKSDLEVRFEEVARILADLDMDAVWAEANERERRVLVENLVEYVKVFPDDLEVKVVGSPSINVLPSEVELKVTGECWCRRSDVNPHIRP